MKICPKCQRTYPDDFSLCPHDGTTLTSQDTATDAQLAAGLSRRYRIIRRLGAGGMGTVFLAEQIGVGNRPVALKVLKRKLLDDPGFLLRFQSEAGSTGRIRHPNVVVIHEAAQADDGTPYIAMEFLEGESLRETLQRRGALAVQEVAEILQQAARGLNAAHKLGIIHRDIKPDNIFLTRDDEGKLVVKLVDFGIAKLRESGAHTPTGMVLGTPAYMSYEQAYGLRSDELDKRSDVYSLGVVVYEMLTGRLPFQSDTPEGFVRMHLMEVPPPFRAVAPVLPLSGVVEAVVMNALTKNRDERYSSPLEFATEFAQAASASAPAEALPLPPTVMVEPLNRERAEQERVSQEKMEAERREQEKRAAERAAWEKAEQERLAREKAEAERREREKAAAERAAWEKAEQERLAREKAEAERREQEKRAAEWAAWEKADQERLAREKAEAERREQEKRAAEWAAWEKAEQERLAREKAEAERREREKAAAQRAAWEKAEQERLAREKAEAERREREKAAAQRAAWEKAEQERLAREKAEAERREREKAAAQRAAWEKAEQERLARELAEAERREQEKVAAELAVRQQVEEQLSSGAKKRQLLDQLVNQEEGALDAHNYGEAAMPWGEAHEQNPDLPGPPEAVTMAQNDLREERARAEKPTPQPEREPPTPGHPKAEIRPRPSGMARMSPLKMKPAAIAVAALILIVAGVWYFSRSTNPPIVKPVGGIGTSQTGAGRQVPDIKPPAPTSPSGIKSGTNAAVRQQVEAAKSQGHSFYVKGEYDDAINAYQGGLKLDPSNAQLLQALRRAQTAKATEGSINK
jgi:hypothetical protein